jgi:hypothetical protein
VLDQVGGARPDTEERVFHGRMALSQLAAQLVERARGPECRETPGVRRECLCKRFHVVEPRAQCRRECPERLCKRFSVVEPRARGPEERRGCRRA